MDSDSSANNSFVVPPGKRTKRILRLASDSESDTRGSNDGSSSGSESDSEEVSQISEVMETSSILQNEEDSDTDASNASEQEVDASVASEQDHDDSRPACGGFLDNSAVDSSAIVSSDSDADATASKSDVNASISNASIAGEVLKSRSKRSDNSSSINTSSIGQNHDSNADANSADGSNASIADVNLTSRSKNYSDKSRSFSDDDSDAIENSFVENPSTRAPQANSTIMLPNVQMPNDNDVSFEFVPDSDEEDAEIENRCFSPRTRQSMGGKYISDISSDSEDEQSPKKVPTESIVLSDSENDDNRAHTSTAKPTIKSDKRSSSVYKQVESDVEVLSSDDEVAVVKLPPKTSSKLKYVSQKYYDEQQRALNELITQIAKSKKMLVSLSLPDNGTAMKRNIINMQNKRFQLESQIELMRVEESVPTAKAAVADDWSKISDAINAIQPKYTGTQGTSTFNNQKTMTLDRLHQLHESMRTCPTEDTLAKAPNGLKVTLMNHQLYALAWLMWREKQRPRGGILADDMGLGKTLTMISLVLVMQEKATDEEESSDSEPDTVDDDENQRKSLHHGGTLIVCPASLVNQWESEVKNRLKGNLIKVVVHHGCQRETRPKYLARADMVITTYAIVARECKSRAALFGIRWKRIILDEAHIIRNHKALQSVACFELKGSCRWSLTGTPIQNKEMDMFAQMKFLRCTPFDDLAVYKKWIGNNSVGNQERMNNVVQPLLLRRTKLQLQEKGALQGLPSKTVHVVQVKLDTDEMNVYQRIMTFSKTLFSQFLHQRAERDTDNYMRDGASRPTFMQSKMPNSAYDKMHQRVQKMHGQQDVKSHQILTYILRLRQICCHPGLIDAMLEDDDGSSDHSVSIPEVDLLEQLNQMNLNSNDSHDSEEINDNDTDHAAISRASSKLLLRSNPVFNTHRASAKFRAALKLIAEIIRKEEKVVVVSQWTSVLNMFQEHIQEASIKHVTLNGQVPVLARNDLVQQFNSKTSGVVVMLLSLTAGGVGLNLVGGNNLMLLDPHWNPQLEAQAQDRVYRVGQTKPVNIYKFLANETIEERINTLQEAKLSLARDVLSGTRHEGGSKLSIDDMKALFDM